jgi:hypothetical protein
MWQHERKLISPTHPQTMAAALAVVKSWSKNDWGAS